MKTTMAGTSTERSRKSNLNLKQYQSSHVGRRKIVQKVSLGFGLIGLIIPLGSEPEKRVDELIDVMADAVLDWDVVPLGMMEQIRDKVSMSGILLIDPEINLFDVAVPLRKADQRRNYFHWNKIITDWEVRRINFNNLKIECAAAMLIVKEKEKTKSKKAVA